jgi:hypothetical protein
VQAEPATGSKQHTAHAICRTVAALVKSLCQGPKDEDCCKQNLPTGSTQHMSYAAKWMNWCSCHLVVAHRNRRKAHCKHQIARCCPIMLVTQHAPFSSWAGAVVGLLAAMYRSDAVV